MTKKFVSLFLALSICLTLSVPAFAAEDEKAAAEAPYAFSFIDGEGKVNTLYVSIPKMGTSHVDYYIDGILFHSVDTCMETEKASRANTNGTNIPENVLITVTDAKTNTTTQYTEPVSRYITTRKEVVYVSPAKAAAAYVYQGRINYNPCYDSFGNSFLYKLNVYYQEGNTTETYKDINVAAGDAVDIVIGTIANVLSLFFDDLAEFAGELLRAAAMAMGATIIAGKIKKAFQKTYFVRLTNYKVKAIDPSTSREQIYDAERYQVLLDGGDYSSEYCYDGCMPWNRSIVANWMYSDFWGDNCPGVKSYS